MQLSVLDLIPVSTGTTASKAVRGCVELARLAESLGYRRYWLAEHHSNAGIASAAPEVLIGYVADATNRIRVGSGGIMLPNHVPLRVAETFKTLEALHSGRIDLGIGRAIGADQSAIRALRSCSPDLFPEQITELVALASGKFGKNSATSDVTAVPSDAPLPPVWLLGSSGATATLAGLFGFGYAFAKHFTAAAPGPALKLYRANFRPSKDFAKPHVIIALSVICADNATRARELALSLQLALVLLRRGQNGALPTPEAASAFRYTQSERQFIKESDSLVFCGSPKQIRCHIEKLARETRADEFMISTIVHDRLARLQSYELLGGIWK